MPWYALEALFVIFFGGARGGEGGGDWLMYEAEIDSSYKPTCCIIFCLWSSGLEGPP